MTESQAAKLQSLRHYATLYELVLTNLDSGEKRRLCYTSKKNRAGIFTAVRNNGEALVAFCGAEDFKLTGKVEALIGRWRLAFSGRTQREAIQAGELRWFAAKEEA